MSRARSRLCRETSRVPASARQSQNVPVSYPRRIKISPLQATQHAHLQGFSASPLTDSNRRPPPYHGGSGAVLAGTAGHSRSRFSCKSGLRAVSPVSARARACSADVPVSYPRALSVHQMENATDGNEGCAWPYRLRVGRTIGDIVRACVAAHGRRSRRGGTASALGRSQAPLLPQRGRLPPRGSGRLAAPDQQGTVRDPDHDSARGDGHDRHPRSGRQLRRDGARGGGGAPPPSRRSRRRRRSSSTSRSSSGCAGSTRRSTRC